MENLCRYFQKSSFVVLVTFVTLKTNSKASYRFLNFGCNGIHLYKIKKVRKYTKAYCGFC